MTVHKNARIILEIVLRKNELSNRSSYITDYTKTE